MSGSLHALIFHLKNSCPLVSDGLTGCLALFLYGSTKKISIDCTECLHYTPTMNQAIASLEHAVEQLGRDDLAVFREWFSSFEAANWDAQIERDISAGKLDKLAAEGIEEFNAGRTRSL